MNSNYQFLEKILNSNDELKEKFLQGKKEKNKKQLLEYVDLCTYRPKDNKDFFKELFSLIQEILDNIDEDDIMSLGNIASLPILVKTALFLRFKKGLNYKEKIKMLKEICKDVGFNELLFMEKFVENELEFFNNPEKLIDLKNRDINKYNYANCLILELTVYKNIILLLKCALYDYHKKELMYFENEKPKFKIVPIKNIYKFSGDIRINSNLNIDELIWILNDIEKYEGREIYDIDGKMAGRIFHTCLKSDIRYDEYNKLLLDKSYNEKVTNKLSFCDGVNVIDLNSELFLNRKVLTPKNGIVILVQNEKSTIESIFLSEQKMDNVNNIYFITRYKDGSEIINSVFLSPDLIYHQNVYGNKLDLKDGINNTLAYVCDFLEIDISSEIKIPELNYEVIAPVYWKYRKNKYITSNDKVNKFGVVIKREFDIEIAPYLRKINGTPSKDALDLARELCIILEKGYTIVKPHIRTYNKTK